MADNENDPSIKINIRTGTSTRRARSRITSDQGRRNHFRHFLNLQPSQNRTIEQESYDRYRHYLNYLDQFEHGQSRMRTRANNVQQIYMQELLAYLQNNNMLDNALNYTLIQSMNDTDLVRHPSVQLDIKKRASSSSDIENVCGICKENFCLDEELSTLDDCSHTFHYNCIDEWGKYKAECPLCRTQIKMLD